MSVILSARNVSVEKSGKKIIDAISLEVQAGSFTAIIGPNGAGKTTLLDAISMADASNGGQVALLGRAISEYRLLECARQRAVLPQLLNVPFAIKAKEVAQMGREPYHHEPEKQHDEAVLQQCLQWLDSETISEQNYQTLSGGEQQRIQIIRVLAQIIPTLELNLDNKLVLLDEPTNHLDIRHQHRLMHCLKFLQKKGLSIVAVMHDITLSLKFAEHIVVLNQGNKVGDFSPAQLVANDVLSTVYGIDMPIVFNEKLQTYLVAPQSNFHYSRQDKTD